MWKQTRKQTATSAATRPRSLQIVALGIPALVKLAERSRGSRGIRLSAAAWSHRDFCPHIHGVGLIKAMPGGYVCQKLPDRQTARSD